MQLLIVELHKVKNNSQVSDSASEGRSFILTTSVLSLDSINYWKESLQVMIKVLLLNQQSDEMSSTTLNTNSLIILTCLPSFVIATV